MPPRCVVLIGFSGSGKSEVGVLLAERLGYEIVDTDAMVEKAAGRTIAAIFERDGEKAFRALESAAVDESVSGEGRVIACGGGAILALRNFTALRDAGTIVYLRTSPDAIIERIGNAGDRPLLKGKPRSAVNALMAERAPAYQSAADLIVDTDGRTPDQVAEAIEQLLKERE